MTENIWTNHLIFLLNISNICIILFNIGAKCHKPCLRKYSKSTAAETFLRVRDISPRNKGNL